MKQIGKKGRINQRANRELKKKFMALGIDRCEISGSNFGLGFAHRRKRREYYGQEEKLSDINEVVLVSVKIHNLMEYDRELTELVFSWLRPLSNKLPVFECRQFFMDYMVYIGKQYLVDMVL